ncbi:hypothetical protein IWQ62_002005, partial [Dispira parvispora]
MDDPLPKPSSPKSSPVLAASEQLVDKQTLIQRRLTCDIKIPDEWAMQFSDTIQSSPTDTPMLDSANEISDSDKPQSPPHTDGTTLIPQDTTSPPTLIAEIDTAEKVPKTASSPTAESVKELYQRRKSQVRFSLAPDTIHTIQDDDFSESESEKSPPTNEQNAMQTEENTSVSTLSSSRKVVHIRGDDDDSEEGKEGADTVAVTPRKQPRTTYMVHPDVSAALSQATPADRQRIEKDLLASIRKQQDDEGDVPLILLQTPAPAKFLSGNTSLNASPASPIQQSLGDVPDLLMKTPLPKDQQNGDNSQHTQSYPPSWLIPVTPAPSLLDTVRNDFISPDKIPKYSFLEMEEVKKQYEARLGKKEEIHQQALDTLERSLEAERKEKEEISAILSDYAETLNRCIEDSQRKNEEHDVAMLKAESAKETLQESVDNLQQSVKNLTSRNEALQDEFDKLTQSSAAEI